MVSPKKNASALLRIGILLLVGLIIAGGVLAGLAIFGGEKGREGAKSIIKQTVGQLAPWKNRAGDALKGITPAVKRSWGEFIASTAHPTGTFKKVVSSQVGGKGQTVYFRMTIQWTGGLLGSTYTLVFEWKFNEQGHVSAEIISDDALVKISRDRQAFLNKEFSGNPYKTVCQIADGKARWKQNVK